MAFEKSPTPVELLAPAGCYPSLRAAIAAGADAVYFGLAQLNMRARSRRSFHLHDLPEIMDICKAGNVRGYLTLNTLLYDHDLQLAKELLQQAACCGVDAVIAADMAAVTIARACGLEVHLSTQLSISNYTAFKFYSQFADRIVLARELNLTMIEAIWKQARTADLRGPKGRPVEIEAFAHGALCIALSGRCGMSLYTDNASANRGACMQNCRKAYTVTDQETGKQLVLDNAYIMSPNDICTLEFVDRLIDSGVHTLKIEGRGRSPEYVATVVTVYRRAIDAIQTGTFAALDLKDLKAQLKTVYNRGFSSGYYLGRQQGWSASYGSQATVQKIEVGRVTHFYRNIHVAECALTAGKIESGDNYTIIGQTSGVVTGTFAGMRKDEQPVASVCKGDRFSFKVDQTVRVHDKLYLLQPVHGAHST